VSNDLSHLEKIQQIVLDNQNVQISVIFYPNYNQITFEKLSQLQILTQIELLNLNLGFIPITEGFVSLEYDSSFHDIFI
jgi:hypothetical protein